MYCERNLKLISTWCPKIRKINSNKKLTKAKLVNFLNYLYQLIKKVNKPAIKSSLELTIIVLN